MNKKAQTDVVDMKTITEAKTQSTVKREEEYSCVLVHSDPKHVSDYFAFILGLIKDTLESEGFKLRLLSGETRDLARYIDEFVNIANECVYSVVILDRLRSNVLFEFGILIGLNKPLNLFKLKDAEISVKTLYIDHFYIDHIEAGLNPDNLARYVILK